MRMDRLTRAHGSIVPCAWVNPPTYVSRLTTFTDMPTSYIMSPLEKVLKLFLLGHFAPVVRQVKHEVAGQGVVDGLGASLAIDDDVSS